MLAENFLLILVKMKTVYGYEYRRIGRQGRCREPRGVVIACFGSCAVVEMFGLGWGLEDGSTDFGRLKIRIRLLIMELISTSTLASFRLLSHFDVLGRFVVVSSVDKRIRH